MSKRKSKQELLALGKQRVYAGRSLSMISFPLGGIGTGSVGLSGRGGLVDWEIFNRPNVGSRFDRTFPIVWAREQGKVPVCRALQAPAEPPHLHDGMGGPCRSGEGFPHMDAVTFRGEYPFAWLDFASKELPVKIDLEAYNPFIPSDPDASGHPAAILHYTVKNTSRKPVDVTLAWSMQNMIGSIGTAGGDRNLCGCIEHGFGKNVNRRVEKDGLRGVVFSSRKWAKDHPRFGTMALLTPNRSTTVLTHWLRGGGFAPMHDFWDTFSAKGQFGDRSYGPSPDRQTDAAALGVRARLKPGESKVFTFYLTWYFPNFEKYWGCGDQKPPVWRNYYASQFKDAFDVARKLHASEGKLRAASMTFHDALFSSTLPPYVLDAVSSQMSTLKTATCLRLEDGTFYGFEGCCNCSGCCEGSCTHVWNYQQALPFLFPGLERSMRSADYAYNMREDGGMGFRLNLPLGSPPNQFHACADGQMGGIMKTYRDWKISGDDAWLRSVWPQVKRALEYAWVQWDPDRDGVMDGIQHNTYDIEFLGPNPLMAAMYLGALKAGAAMADYLGEPEAAATYRAVYAQGRKWIDANLFNGEFYVQQYDPKKAPVHQFGAGCLSDQMLGQWIAQVAGLGDVLSKRHVRKALRAIFKHNWRSDLRDHANAQRVYALHDEGGLILCTWPNGGRPAVPFLYSDEVWTGIEYQVASHLIMEGMVTEGLRIVQAARDRHDGVRRNPWNEFECGHHYARAMSSYGLLQALSGFTYDTAAGRLGFAPKIHPDRFTCFWALDGAWGTYTQTARTATLEVLHGQLKLKQLDLPVFKNRKSVNVRVAGRSVKASVDANGSVALTRPMTLRVGKAVVLKVRH